MDHVMVKTYLKMRNVIDDEIELRISLVPEHEHQQFSKLLQMTGRICRLEVREFDHESNEVRVRLIPDNGMACVLDVPPEQTDAG